MAAPSDLMTIGCGNSAVDCRRAADGARLRLPSAAIDAVALADFLATGPVHRCMLVSVVPTVLHQVRTVLAAASVRSCVAGVDVPCPLPLDYETPGTLGADRWVSAIAAHRRHGRSIVVDCGTATTVNIVDGDGTFRGGAIAPGLRAIAVGMGVATPALPAPDLDATVTTPARSTRAAVDSGVLLGYCGMVERLVADSLRAAGGVATVVCTGGNARRLLRWSRLHAVHEPDLLHLGLEMLAAEATWNC